MSTIAWAGPDSITFLSDRRHLAALAGSSAGACLLPEGLAASAPVGTTLLVTPAPHAAYAAAANRLHRLRVHPAGGPEIHPLAQLEEGVEVASGVQRWSWGNDRARNPGSAPALLSGLPCGVMLEAGRCYIGPNAVIVCSLIGDGVSVYAGAVIGEAGFGAAAGDRGVIDIPQLGRVILQDGVTIGANSCVDRGAYADTVIGENSKIDNLVQIAHNVVIGRNCVFASQCGVSGSVTIGDGCMFGGRVGIADHVNVGAGARLAAAAGLIKDVPAGELGGTPSQAS